MVLHGGSFVGRDGVSLVFTLNFVIARMPRKVAVGVMQELTVVSCFCCAPKLAPHQVCGQDMINDVSRTLLMVRLDGLQCPDLYCIGCMYCCDHCLQDL